MNRYRRRGFQLMLVLGMLPVIAALLIAGFKITNVTLRGQSEEQRLMNDESVLRDLIRQIQQDARQAGRVELEESDANTRLILTASGEPIVYETDGREISRVGPRPNGDTGRFVWQLYRARVEFAVEQIDDAPRLIWVRCRLALPRIEGARPERSLAAAARIGSGGDT